MREKRDIWIDDSLNLFFERTDDHGVSHEKGEGMVKLHLFLDVSQIFIGKQHGSSGVVLGEGGHVEHVVLQNQQSFISFISILLHLFHVVELLSDILLTHANEIKYIFSVVIVA